MRLVSVLLACFLVFGAASVKAGPESRLYQVSDVAVDLTVDATQMARDVAFVEAQKKAFDILMGRLIQKQTAPHPDDATLAAMVSSFEIQKEHIANKRYIGTFSIQFEPAKVQAFLDSQQLAYHEVNMSKLLVLPVYMEEGRPTLWEDVTPWRSAWMARLPVDGVLSMLLPEGDLQDIALISSSEAVSEQAEKMSRLIEKYHADGALIVVYPMISQAGAPAVKVMRLDKSGATRAVAWTESVDSEKKERSLPDLVLDTIKKAEAQYIEESVGDPKTPMAEGDGTSSQETAITANVPVPTLAEWSTVQRKLMQSNAVRHIKVVSMTRGLVVVEIQISQPFSVLQESLKSKGYYLANVGDHWDLRPLDAPVEQ